MEKEFVIYEQAKSLKGLKFDEPCFGYYEDVEVPNPFLVITKISDTQGGYFTFAPLKQQVFRWFREKYDAHMHPSRLMRNIYIVRYGDWDSEAFKTYEEAENACIDKLIEIAKQKDK
jgi:hypothetical protein